MSTLAGIDGFRFTGESSDFGMPAEHHEGPGGIMVQLSEHGIQKLSDPNFSDLLASTIESIMTHDAMHDPAIAGVQSNHIYKIANPNDGDRNMSSVYGDGTTIIKAGLDTNEGKIQFGVMNWLDVRLSSNNSPVQAPTQYAYIQSASGRPTTLMQQVQGQQLQTALHPTSKLVPREHSKEIRNSIVSLVHHEITAAIGTKATKAFMNDIWQHGHVGNIIVEGIPGSTNAQYSVIDQPSFTTIKDRLMVPIRFNQLRKTKR